MDCILLITGYRVEGRGYREERGIFSMRMKPGLTHRGAVAALLLRAI
jgi:hypothetical protein